MTIEAPVPEALREVALSDPEIVSGALCFRGARVPIGHLIDHIEGGVSLDDFLKGYSSVTREQAQAVLDWQADLSRRELGLEAFR